MLRRDFCSHRRLKKSATRLLLRYPPPVLPVTSVAVFALDRYPQKHLSAVSEPPPEIVRIPGPFSPTMSWRAEKSAKDDMPGSFVAEEPPSTMRVPLAESPTASLTLVDGALLPENPVFPVAPMNQSCGAGPVKPSVPPLGKIFASKPRCETPASPPLPIHAISCSMAMSSYARIENHEDSATLQ